jgi:hypothetical protein
MNPRELPILSCSGENLVVYGAYFAGKNHTVSQNPRNTACRKWDSAHTGHRASDPPENLLVYIYQLLRLFNHKHKNAEQLIDSRSLSVKFPVRGKALPNAAAVKPYGAGKSRLRTQQV